MSAVDTLTPKEHEVFMLIVNRVNEFECYRGADMKVRSNIVGYIDRRGPREMSAAAYLDQERADQTLEAEWQRRVSQHPIEIRRILNGGFWREPALPAMLRRQAD